MLAAMMLASSSYSYDQKRETIQAQAFGTGTMASRNFGITIRIEDYSTPAEQKALIDAFKSGGHDAMVKVLTKMKGKGQVAVTGSVGYQIAYIRNIPTKTGRTIRLMTDRPINFAEAAGSFRSQDYDLTLMEIHLNANDKDKSTGNMILGGRFKVNKKNQQIEFESYHSTPWRLAGIMER
ncbi:MAG TPA: hypothetical protein VGJ30_03490 [Candidatus Angelobacter sp.]|jgi:hypothetical protein